MEEEGSADFRAAAKYFRLSIFYRAPLFNGGKHFPGGTSLRFAARLDTVNLIGLPHAPAPRPKRLDAANEEAARGPKFNAQGLIRGTPPKTYGQPRIAEVARLDPILRCAETPAKFPAVMRDTRAEGAKTRARKS